MHLMTTALLSALLAVAPWQEKQNPVVTLPELQQPEIKIVTVSSPLLGEPQPPSTRPKSTFAVYNGTVYFKVGDSIIPMIGTTGCFSAKEILKTGDSRLRFELELPVPPPPPEPGKQ